MPASFLDARNGNRRLRAGRDEHGHVEDPVLLRADQLLAVVEEHVAVEQIVDGELRHEPGRVDLGDAEAERQRLVERHVRGGRREPREERSDDDAPVRDGLAELDR